MTIEEIRDALMGWLNEHRASCGEVDCVEPANALAYLAHCAGVRQENVGLIREQLAVYEAHCPGCQHLRN